MLPPRVMMPCLPCAAATLTRYSARACHARPPPALGASYRRAMPRHARDAENSGVGGIYAIQALPWLLPATMSTIPTIRVARCCVRAAPDRVRDGAMPPSPTASPLTSLFLPSPVMPRLPAARPVHHGRPPGRASLPPAACPPTCPPPPALPACQAYEED